MNQYQINVFKNFELKEKSTFKSNENLQIFSLTKGQMNIHWRDQGESEKNTTIGAGTLFVIPPKYPEFEVRWENASYSEFEFSKISISKSMMLNKVESLKLDYRNIEIIQQDAIQNIALFRTIRNLISMKNLEDFGKDLLEDSYLNILLIEILSKYNSFQLKEVNSLTNRKEKLSNKDKESINQFILENLDTKISLADLALLTNKSIGYFIKCFKETEGCSPYKYIQRLKMREAEKRLLTRKDSIQCIAFELGFSSTSHFSETFKKYSGIKPSLLRKK